MGQSIARKRPWLAALLGALATGFGHLYLRRWRRGFAWVVVLLATTVFFVDPMTVDSLARRETVALSAISPILFVGSLSVLDAYLMARTQNAMANLMEAADGRQTHCPNCNRELDPELEFCHWCTTELDVPSSSRDE